MPASAAKPYAPPSQILRRVLQVSFFFLFALAPVFDLLRYDLTLGHAFFLGQPWHIGIDAFLAGEAGAGETVANILLRLFLPLLAAAAVLMLIAWRWGRLYCGWLCPHFSAVETINRLMLRASGKHSIWDRQPTPPREADGSPRPQHPLWWIPTFIAAISVAFAWAVVFLSYLLPPAEVYGNLLSLSPTRNQFIFLAAATTVLTMEFLFARHLFCRYGCAVGLFQSLAWMANRGAMVVGYERFRAADCSACYAEGGPGHAACEAACPMRLKPRTTKREMFTCTQCSQCVSACNTVQSGVGKPVLLKWVDRDAAKANEAMVSLTGRRD